jgi:AraC family transcriptional regulator, regulatory protein of adaptative response / methylated-DNA-[protein]-cysteine methyltransferase
MFQMQLTSVDRKSARVAYNSEDARWAAVVRRDAGADGTFFYSVKTTGVYCRPSCASRLARRENVQFHSSFEAAERAGFRACKRCRPNGPSLTEHYAAAITKACRSIESADEVPSLEELANIVGMSRFHFHRIFKTITGVTPKAYAGAHRAKRMRTGLSSGKTVTQAIYDAGFNSNARFYATSSDMLGMTPTRFRAGGQGATIRFAVGVCSLGSILVAATDAGVCSILLGDDPDKLIDDMHEHFPKANLIGGDAKFERLVAGVIAFVERPTLGLNLPLDVQGTAFQQRVWRALREIPAGTTASYAEVARRIGAPNAARAIARACASNTIAVAIPCHRVVRSDGGLSGYRWGVARKRALLDREAAR